MEKNEANSDFFKKPIRIIPDANILYSDPFLHSVAAKTITHAAHFMDIKVMVAEITLDEVRNLVNEKLLTIEKELIDITEEAGLLQLTTSIDKYSLRHNSNNALESWEKRWEELKKETKSIPYPPINPQDMGQRSIKEQRPFLKQDKGVRDYLLWVSILRSMSSDDNNYILVSNDHGFYSENFGQLHSDLERELISLNMADRLLVKKSLAEVIDQFIKPRLKPDQIVNLAIKSGKISGFTDTDDKVNILINEYLNRIEIPDEWIQASDYYGASFDVAQDVTMTDLVSTYILNDRVLATTEWECSVNIEVSCPGYQDESEIILISFKVASLIDPKTLEVESHEVTEYELQGWWDPETKERIPY